MSTNSSLNRYRPIVVATRAFKRYRYPNKPPGRRITSCSQTPPARFGREPLIRPGSEADHRPDSGHVSVLPRQTVWTGRPVVAERRSQKWREEGGLGGVPLVIARMAGNPTDPRTRTKGSSAVYDIIRPSPGYNYRLHQRRQARHNGTRGRVVLRP